MVKSNEKGIVSKKQKRGGMWWVEHLAIPLFLAFIVSYGLPQVQYWLNISGAQTRDLYAKIDAIESEIKLAEDKYGSSLGSRFKDYLNQAEYHRWEAKKNLMNSDLRKTKIEIEKSVEQLTLARDAGGTEIYIPYNVGPDIPAGNDPGIPAGNDPDPLLK